MEKETTEDSTKVKHNSGESRRRQKYKSHKYKDDDIPKTPLMMSFTSYRTDLDAKHDKSERLVKLSRDITIESKRVIFLLHRTTKEDKSNLILEADKKLHSLEQSHWKNVALELHGEDIYLFLRSYTQGLQEYVEAVSFLYYLKHKDLVPLSIVKDSLTFHNVDSGAVTTKTISVEVPIIDFALGLTDLGGELMRLAINSIGVGDFTTPKEICSFLRAFYDGLMNFRATNWQMNKKLQVLRNSLSKVENACYTLKIRGSEAPKELLRDLVSSVSTTTCNTDEYDN
ncbi:DgyrCDS11603 [Dimorphilus gyrociliatus]|uniref:DgyrCDS11603 n=1 Tax=Dimorphilus gyrociliatus TaxID=2664684 RepID=A0A7I8W573_9ANNE|nr:DgyrCDS11603 [Dimorphilus gyrociliatus]